jgi:hypothetical protein
VPLVTCPASLRLREIDADKGLSFLAWQTPAGFCSRQNNHGTPRLALCCSTGSSDDPLEQVASIKNNISSFHDIWKQIVGPASSSASREISARELERLWLSKWELPLREEIDRLRILQACALLRRQKFVPH